MLVLMLVLMLVIVIVIGNKDELTLQDFLIEKKKRA